jgi:drug/metabolite transporter (DMT)-like permease
VDLSKLFGQSSLNIYVLVTLLCWGLWGIVDKKALEQVDQHAVMLRLYLLAALWIPVSWILLNTFSPGWTLNQGVILWTGLTSLAYVIALLAYLRAMSAADASYVLGMTAAYPLIFQGIASLVLGEALVPQRLVGAAIIGAGLFLISGSDSHESDTEDVPEESTAVQTAKAECMRAELKNEDPAKRKKEKMLTLFFIIVAIITWGIYGLFDKKAVSCAPPLVVFFNKALWDFGFFFILLTIYSARKQKIDWRNKAAWYFCSLSEIALGLGGLTYLAALAMASASYVITITGCYPLLMYLFAIWLLGERFKKDRFAGILLVVLGGSLVQLTSQQ